MESREPDDRHAVPEMDFELMGEMETLADEVATELGIDDPERINDATQAAIVAALDMGDERDEAALRALIRQTLLGEAEEAAETEPEVISPILLIVNGILAEMRPVAGVDMDQMRAALIEAGSAAAARLPEGAPEGKVTRRVTKAVQTRLADLLAATGEEGEDESETVSLSDVDEDVISDHSGGGKRRRKRLEDDEHAD